ncbi:GntR family transcriptional regulator [Glutamicibacter halophytocola]|uniref:GntR family transcriptional regulator n=1 Tax=Glutamicibacter halophytocola TaxID=1933880 RepID=UPI00321B372D
MGRISDMSPGDKLPAEPELCKEYDVSRITIRRAVDDLIQDGHLVRKQGRGTFVTEPSYIQRVRETFADHVTGFYRQQTALGREVSTVVLGNRLTRNATAAAALGLNPADELVELVRLRYVNGALHQHLVTYMPADRFSGLTRIDFSHGSLFEHLEVEYGIKLIRNDLLVRIERARGEIASALEVAEDTPVLAIDSTVYDNSGQAIQFGVACHTPANSEISITVGQDSVLGH